MQGPRFWSKISGWVATWCIAAAKAINLVYKEVQSTWEVCDEHVETDRYCDVQTELERLQRQKLYHDGTNSTQ